MLLLAGFQDAAAQQQGRPVFNVDAHGMALAQHVPAIETSRLRRDASVPGAPFGVDAHGVALPAGEEPSDDDSLGAQQILKQQEQVRPFIVSGSVMAVGTSNVALASAGEKSDLFVVAAAGMAWTPRLSPNVEAFVSGNASLFRYDRTPALDFENLSLGLGASWTPRAAPGVALFARYDLTQLLGSNGRHILTDHTLTLGAQKGVALGRSHGLLAGVTAAVGFSDPAEAQRDQVAAFVSYRLLVTRRLETEILLRPSMQFYDDFGRAEFNQILTWSARYRFNDWAELNAHFSYGLNRSQNAVFDYDVFTGGGGAAIGVRF